MELIQSFDSPGMFHEGVYYIEDKPLYIVEYYNEDGIETYASVFDVAEESKREDAPKAAKVNPRKAYDVRKEIKGFGGDTILSRMAAKRYAPKEQKRKIDRPPLFTAPIVYGRDTFYGIEGMGFYERTRDKFLKKGEGVVIDPGKVTGVFITLESVDWKRQYVPTEDVLNQYRARLAIWDDLL